MKIYWSPETQEKVINSFELSDNKRDATIFAAQTGLKMVKMRERRNKEEIKSRLTDRILNSKISFRDIFAWKRSDIK